MSFEAMTASVEGSLLDWIRGEVNSKCANLREASRLLPDMKGRESEEMLSLMTEEALQLARSLEEYSDARK